MARINCINLFRQNSAYLFIFSKFFPVFSISQAFPFLPCPHSRRALSSACAVFNLPFCSSSVQRFFTKHCKNNLHLLPHDRHRAQPRHVAGVQWAIGRARRPRNWKYQPDKQWAKDKMAAALAPLPLTAEKLPRRNHALPCNCNRFLPAHKRIRVQLLVKQK